MKNFKEYLQYEQQVLDLLKNIISKENNGNTIKTEYRFPIGNQLLHFDLVELNHEGKLIKVYEIKTQSAIRRNYKYLNYQLQLYQKVTGADVYLVYLGDDKELHIQHFSDSKNQIIEEKDKSQRISMVESFSDFYERLKQICNNEGNELNFFFRGILIINMNQFQVYIGTTILNMKIIFTMKQYDGILQNFQKI